MNRLIGAWNDFINQAIKQAKVYFSYCHSGEGVLRYLVAGVIKAMKRVVL